MQRKSRAGAPDIQLLHTGADLRQISKELRRMNDKEITKRFRKELRAAAAPFVPAVRAAIDDIPVKGTSGSTGLRKRLKKDTKLTVRTVGKNASVSIGLPGKGMPSGQRALPACMEGVKKWRHPVFGEEAEYRKSVHGNREDAPWVTQEPHPFFYRTVRPMGVAAKAAVNRVVNQIIRDIT